MKNRIQSYPIALIDIVKLRTYFTLFKCFRHNLWDTWNSQRTSENNEHETTKLINIILHIKKNENEKEREMLIKMSAI